MAKTLATSLVKTLSEAQLLELGRGVVALLNNKDEILAYVETNFPEFTAEPNGQGDVNRNDRKRQNDISKVSVELSA